MICDAAALLSFFDRDAAGHWAVTGEIELAAESEPLVVSPFAVAELEQTVLAAYGNDGWLAILEELGGGAWTIAIVDWEHLAQLSPLCRTGVSLAAASTSVLRAHHGS